MRKNKSGIYPAGNRVLILADQIEDGLKTSRIELPEEVRARHQSAVASGQLIAVGPDAFQHVTERVYRVLSGRSDYDGNCIKELQEIRQRGYSEPFAVAGDRISFAQYSGQKYTGKDNKLYLVMNDEDITCKLDNEVELSSLKVREPAGMQVPNHSQR